LGHSLQATALVNEAYLRLVEARGVNWQDRAHFLAVAARLMRRILCDFARSKQYLKRGGGGVQVTLSTTWRSRTNQAATSSHSTTRSWNWQSTTSERAKSSRCGFSAA
jgi:hypothetical protein